MVKIGHFTKWENLIIEGWIQSQWWEIELFLTKNGFYWLKNKVFQGIKNIIRFFRVEKLKNRVDY